MTSAPDVASDPPASRASACVHGLVLAGNWRGARHATLPQALGIPPAAVPIDAVSGIADLWARRLATSASGSSLGIALGSSDESRLYVRDAAAAPGALGVLSWTDAQVHRGAGGTSRDYFDWLGQRLGESAPGLLVVEGSVYAQVDPSVILDEVARVPEASFVVTTRGAVPCGIIYLSREALERTPQIGYFDLKEQLIPAIAAAGIAARPLFVDGEVLRIADRASYLAIVARRAQDGAPMIAPSAEIDRTAQLHGSNLLGPSCRIGANALVSNSAVLAAAKVEDGAVVARSVIPPGVTVPKGASVVDQVLSPIAAGGRAA